MLRGRITKVLKTLSYREREIIKLRYGLGDGYSYTLEEVGHIFKVTRERIRQIEAKAVRKLQQPSRSQELSGFWIKCCVGLGVGRRSPDRRSSRVAWSGDRDTTRARCK